ncbi:uncharacterized protein LOC124122804 [Haliotis rufescens]|uniref:uncharacterized protein LOC124122804 n=1 Tax=Haliotis rufescens TaxID=6454 RepID=UPI00201F10C8|nr:uncharacterized protein LOC124122804 [Haliotis rufescens]
MPCVDGSVQLTRFATGHTYTLICSSIPGSPTIDWYWNSELVIRTRTRQRHQCAHESPVSYNYSTYLSARVSVRCDVLHHNVTLRINSTIDDGSEWQCEDVRRDRSNSIIITRSPVGKPSTDLPEGSTFSSTFDGSTGTATRSTMTTMTTSSAPTTVVYVVGAGVGVVITTVIIVIVVCIRRNKGRHVRAVNEVDSATDHLTSTPTYHNDVSGIRVQQDTGTVLVDNDIYEGWTEVTSISQPTENDHVVADLYAQVQKPKKAKMAHTVKAEYVNIKDLDAKPDKNREEAVVNIG